jgi:hypothetical protein
MLRPCETVSSWERDLPHEAARAQYRALVVISRHQTPRSRSPVRRHQSNDTQKRIEDSMNSKRALSSRATEDCITLDAKAGKRR